MINLRIDRFGLQLQRVIEVRFELKTNFARISPFGAEQTFAKTSTSAGAKNRLIHRGDQQLFPISSLAIESPSRNGEVGHLRTAFLLRLRSLKHGGGAPNCSATCMCDFERAMDLTTLGVEK